MRLNRLVLAAAACASLAVAAPPVRVLIVTGQSDTQYHDWRATSAFYKQILESTGRFDVRVVEEPRGLSREGLADYDVVLLNYNGPRWGAGAETALEDFVRSGKGMVSFHGVTYGPLFGLVLRPDGGWDNVPGWKAYREMLGVDWTGDTLGHAPRGSFTVKPSGDNPITRGLPEFTVNDELYHKQSHRPGIAVVASAFDDASRGGTGKNEPSAWTNTFGKGRVFHSTLGHDISAIYEPSAMAMVARAVEWAGTGQVTLPPRLLLGEAPKEGPRVLVVTGGHPYEPSFYEVFASNPRIRWTHMTTDEAFHPGMKEHADVLVLYDMHNEISDSQKKALREFVEGGGGVVSLHHAIVDFTAWPWWYEEVIGGKYFEKAVAGHTESHYKDDALMVMKPVKGRENHPIVKGLGDLVTVDECYRGMWHSDRITPLLETDAACNDRPVVYLGPNPKLRAVYIQLGHGSFTHGHPGYRRLVANAISWAAGQ